MGEKLGIFKKKRDSSSVLFTMKADGTEADKETALETIEMKLDDYRSNFQMNPEAGPDLARRLVALSLLYRDKGDTDRSAAFKDEAVDVVNSAHYPGDGAGKDVKKLVKILK